MTIIASINGRAALDGELRQSQSGKPWCRVSVACEAGADRESGEAQTQWIVKQTASPAGPGTNIEQ
jgi:hypothetical protein